jgi:hypothetical protein
MVRLIRCALCADTGFVPVKRARLYTNPRRRDRDLRVFIIYVLCSYCDIWRQHEQGLGRADPTGTAA